MIKLPTFDIKYYNDIATSKKFHKNYKETCDIHNHMSFHIKGAEIHKEEDAKKHINPYFMKVVGRRRPSESEAILAYRLVSYRNYSKSTIEKVIESCQKILKCPDFKIEYKNSKELSTLQDEYSLEKYCEREYPIYDSVENYAYTVIMAKMMEDPNALVVTADMGIFFKYTKFESSELTEKEINLDEPFSQVIPCENVVDYLEGQFYTFISTYKTFRVTAEGETREERIFITVTKNKYIIAPEYDGKVIQIEEIPHNCEYPPCFIIGGKNVSDNIFQPYYESFLSPMLPYLDAIATDGNDLDAEKTQHIFSTMWTYQTQNCTVCQGQGFVLNKGKQNVKQRCDSCGGSGVSSFNPFKIMEINLNNVEAQGKNIPNPPAGYVQKDTRILDALRKEIDTEKYEALAAVNMEFLYQKPLSGTSGIKTALDRDESNSFIYKIAYHFIENVLKPIYYFTNELRYGNLEKNEEKRELYLPEIKVPESYQFITHENATEQLVKITDSKASMQTKLIVEMDYLREEFSDRPDIYQRIELKNKLVDFPNASIDDLEKIKLMDGATSLQIVSQFHIDGFIFWIESQNQNNKQNFYQMELEEQKKLYYAYGATKLEEIRKEVSDSIDKFADKKEDVIVKE